MRVLAVRVIACALAGAAILFLVTPNKEKESEGLELYQRQTRHPNLFTINAEKIAHGLEEKNRINAEKVIVSYTREDKILAGFQKAVKERDEKFRNEVARVAQESAAEAAATHRYDNHGDPDDPKFDGNVQVAREITPNHPLKSRLAKVVEQKSENVESHINHEVEEITGEAQSAASPPKQLAKRTDVVKPIRGQEENVLVRSSDNNRSKEKQIKVRDASELQKYMDSKAFLTARSEAKAKAEAEENEMSKHATHNENSRETRGQSSHSEIFEPVKKNGGAAQKRKTNLKRNTLPEYLKQYFDGAPLDLKDYMNSPAYLKMRAAAERQSEIYAEEHAKRAEEKSEVLDKPSIITHPRPASGARPQAAESNPQREIGQETRPLSAGHAASSAVHRITLKASHAKPGPAGDDDTDEPEAPEEPQEEPDEEPPEEPEDVPTEGTPEGGGLGEENQIRRSSGLARQAPSEAHAPLAAAGARGGAVDEGRLSKASKLSELRRYMNSEKFKQEEAEARANLRTASTLGKK